MESPCNNCLLENKVCKRSSYKNCEHWRAWFSLKWKAIQYKAKEDDEDESEQC